MNQACRHLLRWALVAAAFVAIASCGGGDAEPPPDQTVPQTISFTPPADATFGDPPLALQATASSGLPVSFTSATPQVCTTSGSMLTLAGAGTCTVTAEQAGDATYAAATPVTNTLAVAPAAQTITFVSPGNQVLGTDPAPLTATASSGLAVSFASVTPAVCTVSGSTLGLLAAGTCTVQALQAGNANYSAAVPVMHSFEVEAALLAQSIDFPSPGNQSLDTAPPPLAATATSGLPVSFSAMTPGVCTVSGTTLTLVAAGECTVAASQGGDATFAAADPVMQTFNVSAAAQTINFVGPGNQTLGTPPPALQATASSGLPVAFSSTTPAVCTVSGTALTLVAAGNCTISADQAGNATYAPAATVTRSVTVASAALLAQTITFASPGNQTLGTTPAPLTATASSGLPVSFASTSPSTCAVSGTTLTLVALGTCIIDASQAGNATYAAAPTVSRVITVAAAPLLAQTISFAGPGSQTLGTPPPALSATASSGLPVSFNSTTPAVCTVNGTTLTLVATGTCSLDANQAGDATYAAAPTVTRAITVNPAALVAQTITFAGPGDQALGTPPPALSATASSGLPVSFSSTTPAVCTVSGTTLALVAVGTCSISADQAGDATYAAAPTVTRSITVNPAPLIEQTITFVGPGNQTLGTPPPALSATASSGLPVSFSSTTPAVCTVSGTTLTLVAAGSCSVDADQAGNATYAAAATVTRTITVSKAGQTITFVDPGPQMLGTPPPALSATASSGLPVSFSSTTPAVCTVSGTTLTLVTAGNCSISADQAGDATYAAAPTVTRSITVNPAPLLAQTITFVGPGNQTLLAGPLTLSATASSGLTVSFSSTTPTVCTVSGTTLTLVATGTCAIDASQAGDATYAAAPVVKRSFTVSKEAQSISFAGPGNQTLDVVTLTLTATASSGLPVSFSSTTPAVCTVAGSTLTLVALGTCSIDANQVGDATYAAALVVTRSFTVNPAPLLAQTIDFASPGDRVLGTQPPPLSATASSGLPVSFSSSTVAVCTVSGPTLTLVAVGSCTINADQAGDATFAPATTVSRTFNVVAAAAMIGFANGGFEAAGASTPAEAWLSAASGYSRSTDRRSGAFSARLASPAFGSAVMLQNSIEQGGRPPLVAGTSPTLRFWAKGTAGATGNVLFALRYLDDVGNIKANSQNVFFQGSINTSTWTEITYNLGAVPAGATAAFIEFAQNIGPIGTGPAGEDWFAGEVFIDDVSLQ
jgi:hypothetical protein